MRKPQRPALSARRRRSPRPDRKAGEKKGKRQKAKGKRQKAKGRCPTGFSRLVAKRPRPFAFCPLPFAFCLVFSLARPQKLIPTAIPSSFTASGVQSEITLRSISDYRCRRML